jgi:very-short-patch-repair endonuclease
VATRELLAMGFSRREIKGRIDDGRLVPRYRGVFAVGPGPLTAHGDVMAAVLFAGPDALASHHAAGVTWRMLRQGLGLIIDVTSSRRIRGPRGIRAHRSPVAADERTRCHGIPLTSTGRTILDCAETSTPREIERMLNEAFVFGLPIKPALAVLLDRYPRRRGAATVRTALTSFEGGTTLTKSEVEERFFDFLDRNGFPRPQTNRDVPTHSGVLNVDLCWPEARLVIEIDAPSTHGSRPKMLKDRRWDRALTLAGWTPARLMEDDFDDEDSLVVEIRGLLGA